MADYVLEFRNTRLAVIEAKAWDEELTEGVAQAKNYAGKMSVRFTYSANGRAIYGIDMETAAEEDVPAFPTPEELWTRTFAKPNAWRDRFAAVPFEDRGGYFQSRYFQDIAVERVMEAIAAGLTRILLTLATGTGKTFIAFQIAWKFFHSRWSLSGEPTRRPRILFLADRNILANQAYNAFSAFPEDALVRIEPGDIRKKGKVPKNGSLFFTIFQTFMASAGSATESDSSSGTFPHVTAIREAYGYMNTCRTFSISSSSTSAIAAARRTRATGGASSNTSRQPCSSASLPRPSAGTMSTPTPISASRSSSTR